jgi:hypothetical protein
MKNSLLIPVVALLLFSTNLTAQNENRQQNKKRAELVVRAIAFSTDSSDAKAWYTSLDSLPKGFQSYYSGQYHNRVNAEGMVYTISCWASSKCGPLTPGDDFQAEIKGTTMWITAQAGGNVTKPFRIKNQILDISPETAVSARAQPQPRIYIEPYHGIEGYLAAALIKERVPAAIVSAGDADYVATITSSMAAGLRSFSVTLRDSKFSIVWADTCKETKPALDVPSAAETCAKHLKNWLQLDPRMKQ